MKSGLTSSLRDAADVAAATVGWKLPSADGKATPAHMGNHQKPPTPDWNTQSPGDREQRRRESTSNAYERVGSGGDAPPSFGENSKRDMNLGNKYATSYSWDNPPPKPKAAGESDDEGGDENGEKAKKSAAEMFGMDKEPSKKMLKKKAARAKEAGALHAAVASGDFVDARELLELGANVDEGKSSDDATTPLLVAAAKGHADVVKLLLKHGANLYAKDDCDNNALHVACSKGHAAVVGRLIKSDVDLSVKAGNGATALHLAARKGHDNVVELLLDNGCDIECTDSKGATPLHAACSGGYEDTVALLLKRGASPHACDAKGKTPKQIAAKKGHDDCSKIIKRAVKDVEANAAAAKSMAEEREKRAILKARAEAEAQLEAQGLANIDVPVIEPAAANAELEPAAAPVAVEPEVDDQPQEKSPPDEYPAVQEQQQ